MVDRAGALGTFCGFPRMVARPSLFVLWCVCVFVRVRVHICVLENCKMGDDAIPPKKSFVRACRGGSYANNL